MQLEQQESFEIKGPQLEVFGEAETRLPAAAKKRPAALAVLAVAIVASVLGIGGAQLFFNDTATTEIYTLSLHDALPICEGMTLESVVTRLGLPMERQFHDALSDTLYTADVCRMLDLRAGLAAYPTEEESLRASLCPTPGDYRDFEVFRGYVEQYTWRTDPKIYTMSCPECGAPLKPDDVWLKKGSNSWYTLSQCPHCAGSSNAAGKGVFQRYKLARRDGLHWSYARCLQIPDDASLARWEKQRTAQLERMKARAEKQAAE